MTLCFSHTQRRTIADQTPAAATATEQVAEQVAERVQEIIEPDVAPVAEAVATKAAPVEQAAAPEPTAADVEQAIIIDGELVITPNSNHGIRYSKIYINFYFLF